MRKIDVRVDLFNTLFAILFLLLGFALILLLEKFTKNTGEVLYIFVFFLPFLSYSILSGRLSEFSAGNFSAKFSSASGKTVEFTSQLLFTSSDEIEMILKEGINELHQRLVNIDDTKIKLLSLKLGQRYSRRHLITYMQQISRLGQFKFIVFTKNNDEYLGCMNTTKLYKILENKLLAEVFLNQIADEKIFELKSYPGFITDYVSTKTTNVEALRKLNDLNLNSLIVIDDKKKLAGYIDNIQIVTRILTDLSK